MKKIKRIVFIIALFNIALPIQAQSWNLQVQTEIRNSISDYSGNEEIAILCEFDVAYSAGSEAISYFFSFGWGNGGSISERAFTSQQTGSEVAYNLYDETRSIILDDSNVIAGSFESSSDPQTNHHKFWLVIPIQNQFPESGQYSDSVRVEGYTGTVSGSSSRNWKDFSVVSEIQVTLASAMVCEVSIVDTGAPFASTSTDKTFDFGNLTTGETQTGDIVVSSTDPYELSIRSENGGVMIRTDAVDPDSEIPYYCYIDESLISLSSTFLQIASGSATDPDGDRYNIKIEIGDFWGINAGEFEDIIYIELTSQ
ncbi:spore coat protein U domain-containing protein [Spirochaeta isovalerica]|uniref:Spore coat protein U/FanG domain-containing protein n=1 Tax=Spirochaeta isovalerica TaxID=150 RepID=A0A841R735_9SPIO|nr:spore coat protein U domain-containing protein [Spirochaeta isovalerica]MBB6481044.1 hypothetical protein [Spirochaeta isovalerica]